jgi:hypothetical protein
MNHFYPSQNTQIQLISKPIKNNKISRNKTNLKFKNYQPEFYIYIYKYYIFNKIFYFKFISIILNILRMLIKHLNPNYIPIFAFKNTIY